jgi:Sigma-70 region 2
VRAYLQIFRARVPQQSMAALLEIRPAAIAEAQRLCPELLRAQLVRLDDGTWLDVLTWSRPGRRAATHGPRRRVRRHHQDARPAGGGGGAAAGRDPPPFLPMRTDDLSLDELARRAAEGDREALSTLVRDLQHPMYRLALRFLGHPDDAQDACQEILVRIVTHLGSFDGRSRFTTWAYTVAVRSLLRTRKRLIEASVQGAEAFVAFLDAGMGEVDPTLEEVRISCTTGCCCACRDPNGPPTAGRHARAARQRGGRDPGLHPGGVPPAGLAGPAHPAAGDRQPLRAPRPGQPVSLRPPARQQRGRRHPQPRSRAVGSPCPPGGAGLGRTRGQAAGRGGGHRELYRFDRLAAPARLWEELQARFPDLLTSA